MVIDKNIENEFKKRFGLDFGKYRDDAYSAVCGRDCVDMIKLHDYLSRKYKFAGSMVECIEKEYGKECREWWESTFCGHTD